MSLPEPGHGRLEEHRRLIVTDIPVAEAVVRIGAQGSVALADRFVLERWLLGRGGTRRGDRRTDEQKTAAIAMRNGLNPFTKCPFDGDARVRVREDTTRGRRGSLQPADRVKTIPRRAERPRRSGRTGSIEQVHLLSRWTASDRWQPVSGGGVVQ